MNCQDFENIIDDLSRGALMDARTRGAAHAHAGECRRCATRLADEKSLRDGLRSLAAGASHGEAPPRVESSLLAAFRAQAAANAGEGASAPAVVSASTNVTPLARPTAEKRWTWTKTFATAATAAAAAAILFMIIPPFLETSPGSTVAVKPKTGQTEVKPQNSKTGEPAEDSVNQNEVAGTYETAGVEPPRASNPQRGESRMTPASYNPSANKRAQPPRRARPAQEVVTEFIPLGNSDYSASVDAGQLVRVELPRSALSSIGLPVSADRAGERIKADVLLGEDGLARAIRFVR